MATQSQDVPHPPSQPQSSSLRPRPKRSLFTRSSYKRRAKNKEIQSSLPPQINSDGQSPSSPSDNPPSASSVPTPSEAAAPSSPSTETTGQDGHTTSPPAPSNPSAAPPQDSVPTASQAPTTQAPTQLVTTSSTTVASLPGSATPSAPAASEPTDDPDREKEKDKGSLSTTLTGTHPTRVSRKGAQSSSEGAHSSTAVERPSSPKSAAKHRVTKSPSSPRVSFISRLLRFLVPCVGPSRLLNEAVNEVVSDPSSSATALREKSAARDAEKDSSLRPVQETPVSNDSVSEQPHPNAELAPSTFGVIPESGPGPLHVTPPTTATSDKDLDIIVPPTPTKVIPESETGGVTSSAVVPPGSTAEEVAHLRALQAHEPSSGDESDGTSFTEDEEVEDVPGIDEVEDDEDRLILSGGAGIPIGPVSAMTLLSTISH
jgi:RNA polymerase II subunit A small phosphatase-like protein